MSEAASPSLAYEDVYLSECARQCWDALACVEAMNATVHEDIPAFFRSAQAFLNHCAAISRLFWPPGEQDPLKDRRAKKRGRALRDTLALPDSHVLHGRTLRNHLEHFDSRLDDWAEESQGHNLVDQFIGPSRFLTSSAFNEKDCLRHYDPDAKVYTFRGDQYDIQALAVGVQELLELSVSRARSARLERIRAAVETKDS